MSSLDSPFPAQRQNASNAILPLNQGHRTSMTDYVSRLRAQEQEAHAAEAITQGVDAAHRTQAAITSSTARLIAAGIHGGAGSALERFAATGELKLDSALKELDVEPHVAPEHVTWVAELRNYLGQINGQNGGHRNARD